MTTNLKTWYAANLVNNQIDIVKAIGKTPTGALQMPDGYWMHFPHSALFDTWTQARTWIVKQRRQQWKGLRSQMDILSWQLDEARDWEDPTK